MVMVIFRMNETHTTAGRLSRGSRSPHLSFTILKLSEFIPWSSTEYLKLNVMMKNTNKWRTASFLCPNIASTKIIPCFVAVWPITMCLDYALFSWCFLSLLITVLMNMYIHYKFSFCFSLVFFSTIWYIFPAFGHHCLALQVLYCVGVYMMKNWPNGFHPRHFWEHWVKVDFEVMTMLSLSVLLRTVVALHQMF